MTSKRRMLAWVREHRARQIQAALDEDPSLLGFRDRKGRNWLHICCSVNTRRRGGRPADSIRTAEALLDAGLDINEPAFREGTWKATALWYAIAFGENLALARLLLKRGSDPNHCMWAAVNRDNPEAIRLLHRYGAEDPSTAEASPFLAAIRWNKFAAAEQLLKLGADVNFQDANKMTGLHYLLEKRSDKSHVRMLLRHGARADLKNGSGVTAAEIMMRKRDPEFRALAGRLRARS